MKKAFIATMILLLVSVVVAASWDDVPDNKKTELRIYSYDNSLELTIRMYLVTLQNLTLLIAKPGEESAKTIEDFIVAVNNKWPGQKALMVAVIPNGTQYFFPWDLAFTQGTSQYDVKGEGYEPITDSFTSGQLREGVVAMGVIAIPKDIDLTNTFRIWYNDTYTVMPALQNTQ